MEETCWKIDKAGCHHVDILLNGQTQMWLVAEITCERSGYVSRVFLVEKPWPLLPRQCPKCGKGNYHWDGCSKALCGDCRYSHHVEPIPEKRLACIYTSCPEHRRTAPDSTCRDAEHCVQNQLTWLSTKILNAVTYLHTCEEHG